MASLEEAYNNSIRDRIVNSTDHKKPDLKSELKGLEEERTNFKPTYIRHTYFDEKPVLPTNVVRTLGPITVDNRSDSNKFYEVESMNRRILMGPSRIMTNKEMEELDAKFNAIDPKVWKHPPLSSELYDYYLKNIKNTRNKNTNCIVF